MSSFQQFTTDAGKAAQLTFATIQAGHIETELNKTLYPDIQYPSLIPVDTSAHEFARSVEYQSSDKFGKAEWINGNSDDIPLAGTELAKHETQVYMAGIGYGWSFEEMGQAMMVGRNLPADDAEAARRAYEEKVDEIALRGDATKGFTGLMNAAGVPVEAVANGNWNDGATTADQIIADINKALLGVGVATGFASAANTLLVSPEKMERLGSIRIEGTDKTAFEYIMRNNVYTMSTGQPLTVRTVRGLNTAGAGGTSRMTAYRNDRSVLRLHIPMPHRFLPVYQTGALNMVVPGVFRVGGLDVRRPKEMRYVDGI